MSYIQNFEQGVENRIEGDVMNQMGMGAFAPHQQQQQGFMGGLETNVAHRIEGGFGMPVSNVNGGMQPMAGGLGGGLGGGALGGMASQVLGGGYPQQQQQQQQQMGGGAGGFLQQGLSHLGGGNGFRL